MTQTIHRPGCSIDRNGNCLCAFLSQWDSKPALKESYKGKLLNEFAADEDHTLSEPLPAEVTFTRSPELQELHDAATAPDLTPPSQVFVNGKWKDWAAAEEDPDFWNTMAAPMGPHGPLEIMSATEFAKQYPHGIESGLAGPGILVMPDGMVSEPWDSLHAHYRAQQAPAMCHNHQGGGWHDPDGISCTEWDALTAEHRTATKNLEELLMEPMQEPVRAADHQPGAAPFPMEERDYYPSIDRDITALTVNGEIWEPRALRLKAEDQRDDYKQYWRDRALTAERHRFHLTAAGAVLLAVTLAAAAHGLGWF